MKKRRRRRSHRRLSHMGMLFFSILGIVLIGDIVGAIMYLRQTPEIQESLVAYVMEQGENQSTFFQILSGQMRYQLTIWGLGATILGNLVNVFLIFTRGVSAGFNLTFLIREVGLFAHADVIFLWLFQHLLVLLVMILNVYFSVRFAYSMIKLGMKKNYRGMKKQARIYINQLIVIFVLTVLTSLVTTAITPNMSEHLMPEDSQQEEIEEVEA